MGAVKISLY